MEYVDYVTARIPALRRLAYLLAGDEHRADDLVQQTITTLYVKWRRAVGRRDGHDPGCRVALPVTGSGRSPQSAGP
ncbi:hypothetical protein [Micromonospora sp. A200]|uniref:hypothetical protein n=1 Tax=Micromonospora sp. A200 TaxID=2940568 RepID=UPI00247621CE|nr:hypothetical protein [Micromonospora sp. A200]